ncbi:MAG: DNA topoisomerase I [Parcubacteria group bacterium GW2011_GWA2_38_13b]|nr:MAG: DNA topoisomerase I [Parcubacteria group bacterium GW2011_GWA2_38_13b]
MKLIIVESPTKARTISQFLGKNFTVLSSYGHVRDLPKKELGIDIENNFKPKYVIPLNAKRQVMTLKEQAKKSDTVVLATDEDREGEAIAWHIANILKLKNEQCERIVFHEITKKAIEEALKNPRKINLDLVDAQQARRILDRLVGYKLSPFLWKKVAKGLSAGRVQSVAVRIIVDREREIEAFKPQEYWHIYCIFEKEKIQFIGDLARFQDKKIGRLDIKNEMEAQKINKELAGQKFQISKLEQKEILKYPYPPFTTSTLQQAASVNLHFSAKQTMRMAQQLYEGVQIDKEQTGLITYMRTDSLNLADEFLDKSQKFISNSFGNNYSVAVPRRFKTKSKGAQEAHEAIRPTDPERTPESIKNYLAPQQYRLYNLIWKRAVASQMTEAIFDSTKAEIKSDNEYFFVSKGEVMKFDGFLKVYSQKEIKDKILPPLNEKDEINMINIKTDQKSTEPPARYSEAALIKILEEKGIGRPSTYAPTISTIQDRNYVLKNEQKKLQPTEMGTIVNDLLVEHFSNIVDFDFTAKMEKNLDEIAEGKKEWPPMIKEFYEPFAENLKKKNQEINKKDITEEESDEICEKCEKKMVIKLGRYGKFLACSNYPECKNTKPLDEAEKTDEICEKCGSPMKVKHGRFGAFLGCSKYPECKNIKSFAKMIGVKCPKCGEGEVVEKMSRKRRLFFGCNRWPKCDFASWKKPETPDNKNSANT